MTRSSTPAHARAHARVNGRPIGPRCAHVVRNGLRCFVAVEAVGDLCLRHEGRLPRELWVLRDPRTGEPLEVT